jgi:hypothetical protein
MVDHLADSFHEAWRKIHFSQRGEGTARWKQTSDKDWVTERAEDFSSGAPWIRVKPGAASDSGVYEVDIAALSNRQLPVDRATENFVSSYVALAELLGRMQDGGRPGVETVLQCADAVHRVWLEGNPYVFESRYDKGGAEDSPEVRLMREPFSKLYERGKMEKNAAAEALKDIETVLVAIGVLNDSFKAQIPKAELMKQILEPLALS